jgi:fluoride exporter
MGEEAATTVPSAGLTILLVAIGSALGGVARYLLGGWLATKIQPMPDSFPWGIFVVNVTGCFLLGALSTYLNERGASAWAGWRPLVGVGFLGGYTTFSTLLWDTWRLGPKTGFLNLIGSGIAGYIATALAARLFAR